MKYSYINKPLSYEGTDNYVFVSYSHNSEEAVYDELWKLHDKGVRFWYDDSIRAGEDWEKVVKPKIEAAAVVLFFVDKNFFFSSALEKEVRYVRENKKYIPFYYCNKSYKDIKKSAYSEEDKDIDIELDSLLNQTFNPNIISIIKPDNDGYLPELIRNLNEYRVCSDIVEEVRKEKPIKKVLFLAKNSMFSNSIIQGVSEGLSNAENYNLSVERILKKQGVLEEVQFYNTLAQKKDDYDIFVIRPLKVLKDDCFKLLSEICRKKQVILVDVDVTPEQRAALKDHAPIFVSSDFAKGGELLGKEICALILQLCPSSTKVLLCYGPDNKESAKSRCNAINNELFKAGYLQNCHTLQLNSFVAADAMVQIENKLNGAAFNSNNKNLIIYTGNDTIAQAIIEKCHDAHSSLGKKLRKFEKVIFCGYDGVKNIDGKSVLHNSGFDYVTVDVTPMMQGLKIAEIIADNLYNCSKRICVSPVIDKHLVIKPSKINSLNKIGSLLSAKKFCIFDLDGTIADTESLHWLAYNVLLKEQYGIELKDEDIRRYIGNSEVSIYRKIEQDFNITINTERFLAERLEKYLELVEETGLKPFKWVYEFIDCFAGSMPVILLTSQVPEIVDKLLSVWKLDSLIPPERRVSAHNGKITKAEVFANPSKYVDIEGLAAADGVVFEDSEHVMKLAAQNGYTVIGIEHKYNLRHLESCSFIINENHKRGLFVGLCNLDILFKCNMDLPAEDSKIKVDNFMFAVGGPAAVAAKTLAQLGGDATLVTCIGNSIQGKMLKSRLFEYGITIFDLAENTFETPNVSCVYINKAHGTRTIISGQQRISDEELVFPFEVDEYDYCLYDCNLPPYSRSLSQILESKGIPMVLDAGAWKPHIEDLLEYADYVIASEKFKDEYGNDIFELSKKYNIAYVAKTRGAASILFSDGQRASEIEVQALSNVNTLGAGDIFHGAFCYYFFICGHTFEEALTCANKYTHEVLEQNNR